MIQLIPISNPIKDRISTGITSLEESKWSPTFEIPFRFYSEGMNFNSRYFKTMPKPPDEVSSKNMVRN